jgi:hypothetical protein
MPFLLLSPNDFVQRASEFGNNLAQLIGSITWDEGVFLILTPIAFCLIGVAANGLSRRDGDKSPPINDWAFGTQVFLMTIGVIANDFRIQSKSHSAEFFGIFVGTFLLFVLSMRHDRINSWIRDPAGLPTDEKRFLIGIILPNAVSLVVFLAYELYALWLTHHEGTP